MVRQEDDERQQQLRERARKLIAEARQGLASSGASTPAESSGGGSAPASRKGSNSRSHSHSPSPAPSPTESIQKFLSSGSGANRLASLKNFTDKDLSRKCTVETLLNNFNAVCFMFEFCSTSSENSGQGQKSRGRGAARPARTRRQPVHCQ